MKLNWSSYKPFPDPRKMELLHAPFGAGVYELRNNATMQLVLVGKGNNVAHRMTSLLPEPHGCGTRNNSNKRNYIFENLKSIQYRTLPCANEAEALSIEKKLRNENQYIYKT
jgi:hypothetical protein